MEDTKKTDPLLGVYQLYTQFVPRRNSVEYTVFFKIDDCKFRMDIELSADAPTSEEYLLGRIHERYERRDFVEATIAVLQTNGYAL